MAQVGKVQAITGTATARTPEGQVRELHIGDVVSANEIIETATGATLSLIQEDGNIISLSGNDQILLDESVTSNIDPRDAVIQEVAELQEAIAQTLAEGGDIDDITEEPAAGTLAGTHDFQAGYYSGDDSTGDVGTYLLDGDSDRSVYEYNQYIADEPDNEVGQPQASITTDDEPNEAEDVVAQLQASITLNDNIAGDGVLNGLEAGSSIAITGTVGGDVKNGDVVTLIINNNSYTGPVIDGTFSIEVPGSALLDDIDSLVEASVTTTGPSGNSVTATDTETYTVDTEAGATITVDSITADDIVNSIEDDSPITVTGTVGGDATPGDTVSFTVNGTDYTTTVNPDLTWNADVAGVDLATDTSFDATVTGTDENGNPFTGTTTSTHTVDLAGEGSITVDNITTDDIVNASEAGGNITVTGTIGGELAAGDPVTFTVNSANYTGTVDAGGTTWTSVPVLGSDLAADTEFTVTATGSDTAGNPISATADSIHTVDLAGQGTITVDNITTDDIVNASEAGGNITVTGTIGGELEAGDPVTFTVNSANYTGTVDAGGTTWTSVPVLGSDLAADTEFTVTAAGTDTAGNPISATADSVHTVDLAGLGSITVDNITTDDIINAAEAGGNITVTGTIGGELEAGDPVTFTVNSANYTGTVDAGGTTWTSVPVLGSDLAADTEFTVTAAGTDTAGNPISATADSVHTVDLAGLGSITVDNITTDDIINAAEAGGNITVTGTIGGELEAGDPVTFTVNSANYTGTVDAGGTTWTSVPVLGSDLAADTEFTVTATGTDTAGNPISADGDSVHTVDLAGEGSITVDNITTDDIVNASEAGGNITVTGTIGGELAAGDPVTFTVNGNNYTGTVDANGTTWTSVPVAGSDLAADTDFTATATGTDAAGNPISADGDSVHTVDLAGEGSITVDNITTDDIVNASEAGGNITVTGTIGGELAAGDPVTFTVNGNNYTGTVDAGGTTWTSVPVLGSDLVADTEFTVTATGTDTAGNPISADGDSVHTVDLAGEGSITVDNITTDDIVNASEAGGNITITG
ncbi:MAG: hypothetical protein ACI8ZB_003424, partial [Desulforhopalus sp.]